MQGFLVFFLKQFHRAQRERLLGLTLIEVLAATIASAVLVSALLSGIVSIARDNQIDAARTTSDREVRATLDFITEELRTAIYIYTAEELDNRDIRDEDTDGVLDALDIPDAYIPALVFWKAEPFPYNASQVLPAGGCEETGLECQMLTLAQRTYTLVAYFLDTDPTQTWDGQAVIRRYELRKYQASGNSATTLPSRTIGYIDPTNESTFALWPYFQGVNRQDTPPAINGSSAPVLADFIDSPTAADSGDATDCEGNTVTANSDPANLYSRVPANGSDSFFTCVRKHEPNRAQDVVVALRGNPTNRLLDKGFRIMSDEGWVALPTIKTRVAARSIENKVPQ